MTVGEKIRNRRMEIGMKASALAEKLGVSRATIYRYEGNGVDNLPAEFIIPLAEALRTTPQWLLDCPDAEKNLNDDKTEKLLKCINLLSDDSIDKILEYAELLLLQQNHTGN